MLQSVSPPFAPGSDQDRHPSSSPQLSGQQDLEGPPAHGISDLRHLSSHRSQKKPDIWQLVSVKELVFIFVLCSFGVLLFRTRDAIRFMPVWLESIDVSQYSNLKFPLEDEKLSPPIVTDLDSDGNLDMILLFNNNTMKLFTFPAVTNTYSTLETRTIIEEMAMRDLSYLVREGVRPVTMASGYLRRYQSMLQIRHQVVAVLMSDWMVLCFDHELKLLWKVKVADKEKELNLISEATILISPVSIHKGDLGSIIVGGREVDFLTPIASVNRMRRIMTKENEENLLKTLDHYTMYALEGRRGEIRWHHTPGDFQITPAYPPESSSFRHLKLLMFKHSQHFGEVSWHQYSAAIRDTLPHTWQFSGDTYFSLAHFKKDRRPSEKSEITDHISKVGSLAVDHIAGLTFGGQQPHSASEHVEDPNVLILHSIKGIEVIHLYQGRPLCSLPLSPYHSSHVDINGDDVIDHISAIHNPGKAGFSEDSEERRDCYGKATSMKLDSKVIFKHSICRATHWTEQFVAIDKWMPQFRKVGRKKVEDALTEPLAPILIPSSYHNIPLKLHISGVGWDVNVLTRIFRGLPTPHLPSTSSPVATLYDSVFVLSSGRVTSIGPHGEFNWQVDTTADWDTASQVIYDPSHTSWESDPEKVQFLHNSFIPSAVPFSLQVFGKKDHIMIMGWDVLTLLSGKDGTQVASVRLQDCHPVAPLQVVDFSGDGWNDVIITCPDKFWAFSLNRKSGFWQTSLLSMFVGVVIVVLAMYTRQRTVGVLPPVKAAQD